MMESGGESLSRRVVLCSIHHLTDASGKPYCMNVP